MTDATAPHVRACEGLGAACGAAWEKERWGESVVRQQQPAEGGSQKGLSSAPTAAAAMETPTLKACKQLVYTPAKRTIVTPALYWVDDENISRVTRQPLPHHLISCWFLTLQFSSRTAQILHVCCMITIEITEQVVRRASA
jgi:hypothetical protein